MELATPQGELCMFSPHGPYHYMINGIVMKGLSDLGDIVSSSTAVESSKYIFLHH